MIKATLLSTTMLFASLYPTIGWSQNNGGDLKDSITQILRENPEILIEAIHHIQQQQEELARQQAQERQILNDLVENTTAHPTSGNPDGDITVVFFVDRNCQDCARAQRVIDEVVQQDSNVRVVTHEWPREGNTSRLAAMAALAANAQEQHTGFLNRLIEATGNITMETIVNSAVAENLDLNTLVRDLESEELTRQIEHTQTVAGHLGLTSAPAFIVGQTIAQGLPNTRTLLETIERERNEQP